MIEKKIAHYALENVATIYDEEALTALELAGRTAAKVNECIDDINKFETNVAPKLAAEAVKKELTTGSVAKAIEEKTGEAIEELIGGKVDGYVYVSSEGSVNIEPAANGGIKISISKPLVSAIKGYEFEDNSWETIGSELESLIEINGEAASITLPQFRRVLVLDLLTMKLADRNFDNVKGTDYVLIANAYANAVSGALMVTYLDTQAKNSVGTPVAHYTVEKGYVYVSGGLKPTLTKLDTGAIMVYFPAQLAVRFTGEFTGNTQYEHIYGALNWSEATNNASMTGHVSTDGTTATITVPANNVLVFNMLDKQLYNRYHTSVKAHDFVLLKNGWGNVSGGALYEMDLDRRITNIEVNAPQYIEPASKLETFTELLNVSNNNPAYPYEADSFLYFTDPHLAQNGEDWKPLMKSYIEQIKATYDRAPVSFALCGGDWLGNSDTQKEACNKLGYINGTLREAFKTYYPVNGNHDTNYQGERQLHNGAINMLMYRDFADGASQNYYSFETANALYLVFDCGVENRSFNMYNTYEMNQIAWFIDKLKKNTKKHIVLVLHTIDYQVGLQDNFARNVFEYAHAFNSRGMHTGDFPLTGDFTESSTYYTGRVEIALGGHLHIDANGSYNGIPYVLSTNLRAGSRPTYDLCKLDFVSRKLNMVRIGTGIDREITF